MLQKSKEKIRLQYLLKKKSEYNLKFFSMDISIFTNMGKIAPSSEAPARHIGGFLPT